MNCFVNRKYHADQLPSLRAVDAPRKFATLLAALFVAVALFVQSKAATGDLDPVFSGGKVTTDFFGENDVARDVVIQQLDGKILVVGSSTNSSFDTTAGLARYNPDGTPDQTFGIGGKVTSDFFNYLYTVHCAIQPNDGKIVVVGAGIGAGGSVDWAIARFMPNGDPDLTFGVGGGVKTDFFGSIDVATSVDFQTDGKILVAGGNTKNGQSDWAVMRFDADGTPDPGFGVGGKLTLDFFGLNEIAYAVAVQPDGMVLVAGTTFVAVNDSDIALARWDTNGNPDPAFGVGGKVTTNVEDQDYASAMVLQDDGKIVVAGQNGGATTSADFALVRYDTNGTPDPGFGFGGKVTTDFFGEVDAATDLVIQPNGKIIAVGAVYQIGQIATDFGVARYDTNGTLDATFGIGGLVSTNFTDTDIAEAVAIQPDCKIVAVGYTAPENTTNADFAIARYDGGAGCGEPPVQAACPKPQGYWKNNPSVWPVDSLILGTQTYTKAQLLAILNNSTQSDASIILAKQLIAAKLNVANGSEAAPVSNTIAHADSLFAAFNGKLAYKVKSSSATGKLMVADGSLLESYNNGLLTPTCNP